MIEAISSILDDTSSAADACCDAPSDTCCELSLICKLAFAMSSLDCCTCCTISPTAFIISANAIICSSFSERGFISMVISPLAKSFVFSDISFVAFTIPINASISSSLLERFTRLTSKSPIAISLVFSVTSRMAFTI